MSDKHAKPKAEKATVTELPTDESAAGVDAMREQINLLGSQLQSALVTIDSLKQRIFDLNMELVDKDSQIRVMNQRATPPPLEEGSSD